MKRYGLLKLDERTFICRVTEAEGRLLVQQGQARPVLRNRREKKGGPFLHHFIAIVDKPVIPWTTGSLTTLNEARGYVQADWELRAPVAYREFHFRRTVGQHEYPGI